MGHFERILAEARALLTEDERVRLSGCLLEEEPDPAVEKAWRDEVQRRRARRVAGETKLIPWEEVRERLFRREQADASFSRGASERRAGHGEDADECRGGFEKDDDASRDSAIDENPDER